MAQTRKQRDEHVMAQHNTRHEDDCRVGEGATLNAICNIMPQLLSMGIECSESDLADEQATIKYCREQQHAHSHYGGETQLKSEKLKEVVSTVATKSNIPYKQDMFDEAFASDWKLKKSKTADPTLLTSNIRSLCFLDEAATEQIKSSIDVQQGCDQASYLAMNISYGSVYPQNTWYYPDITEEMMWYPSINSVPANILRFSYAAKLSLNETYNLFSNFGNIQKIVKKASKYYVVFTNDGFAQAAKDHLNGLTLFNTRLSIEDAHPDQILEKPREYSESISYDPSHDRFNLSKPLSINPPSIILHISNLKKDTCSQPRLRKIFEQYGKIEKIQLLLNIKDKWMALIRYSTLQESLNATTALHNVELSGRRMHISFTKSKI